MDVYVLVESTVRLMISVAADVLRLSTEPDLASLSIAGRLTFVKRDVSEDTRIDSLLSNSAEARPSRHLIWVEPLKAIALLWIFLDHVAERVFGSPYFANPDAHWPQLSERVGQFFSLPPSMGGWGYLVAAARNTSWLGDQGVSIFLLLSGLTLTWSCLLANSSGRLFWKEFYWRRLSRIYPIWIVANLLLLFPFAIFGVHLSLLDARLYLSLVGIRVLPDQLYYGNSAWWFVTLLLQLYLVFPLLWVVLQCVGPVVFAMAVPAVAIAIRGIGLLVFHDYLDAWARGAIFVTRLPEFAIGMSLGMLLFDFNKRSRPLPPRWILVVLAIVSFGLGLIGSFTLLGMTVAPVLQGFGAFLLLYGLFSGDAAARGRVGSVADWIGRHSLSLFLVHQPFVRLLIPEWSSNINLLSFVSRLVLVIAFSAATAILLERITEAVIRVLKQGKMRWGALAFNGRIAGAFLFTWSALIAGELTVRHVSPQEAPDLGWGERPALQPDPTFGWKLRPLERKRLRWVSYDYEVQANSLGFPGPEYPAALPKGVQRIFVTGDAFSSAEGVDTGNSWPRLLEKDMASLAPGSRPEVLNFAVTGYGPNQYQKVVEHFAPLYHPNVVLIGLFINDYQDVMTTNAEFQKAIGFWHPDTNGVAAVLTVRQLSALVRLEVTKVIYQDLLRRPDPDGYFLGQFVQLERGVGGNVEEGRGPLGSRLAEIKKCTDRVGARLIVILIPSGPQVCTPQALSYWPKYTSLSNPKFDATLPQRTTKKIDSNLGIETVDLLPLLRSATTCPYQTRNMHWTIAAHQLVAEHIAHLLHAENRGPK
jgi:peptidoglycan/LPS O-acetylase OafA/YrhL